jgi:hypothetical protein
VPRTAAQRVLDLVVASALVPALREAGYRRDKRTFRRTSSECIQVVNVQSSQWGSAASQRFTLNLGVFFPRVHDELAGYSGVRIGHAGPREAHCHLRQRIGGLMPERRDLWWDIEAAEDPSSVSNDARAALTRFGLPWLEAMAEFDTARRAVQDWPLQALGFDPRSSSSAARTPPHCGPGVGPTGLAR